VSEIVKMEIVDLHAHLHPSLGDLDPNNTTETCGKLDVYIYLTKHAQTRRQWVILIFVFACCVISLDSVEGMVGRGGKERRGEEKASYHLTSHHCPVS
jgi:hypothetical protein